jgi:DNA-binding NarL/FixJ family response regulator
MIRVLLVDDHAVLRRVLRELFEETPDITVVGECADGAEVVAAATATRPDVVLMDLSMPGVGGLEATRRLLQVRPQARVVLLTGSFSVAAVREAQRLGAAGYLLKGDDPFDLPQRIRDVAAGGSAWNGRAAAELADVC